jgi:uncharacterized protein YjbI with pentapeptide repeats
LRTYPFVSIFMTSFLWFFSCSGSVIADQPQANTGTNSSDKDVPLPVLINEGRESTPARIYSYDPRSGRCLDKAQTAGWNAFDAKALFPSDAKSSSDQIQIIQKDAECVDFTSVNFSDFLNAKYPQLIGWNLKGAKFGKASMHFIHLLDAKLEGTDFSGLIWGYTKITGSIDSFSQVPTGGPFGSPCKLSDASISCKL